MSRWFLPATPDVLGMLKAQTRITIDAVDALEHWASGDEAAGEEVRRLEHQADDAKRSLRVALRDSFTTPIEGEDLYALSERLDALLNGAKDLVREAEVMKTAPDEAMATMASELALGVGHLAQAMEALGSHGSNSSQHATDEADAGIKQARKLEHTYRAAMSALLEVDDVRELTARRELYRRFTHLGDLLAQIGDRVWYAVIKES
ncbi:MAG: DUF47 domain-containing protein [Acidimicrobiales bacterium]